MSDCDQVGYVGCVRLASGAIAYSRDDEWLAASRSTGGGCEGIRIHRWSDCPGAENDGNARLRSGKTIPHQSLGGKGVGAVNIPVGGQCKRIRTGESCQKISTVQVKGHLLHARVGAAHADGAGDGCIAAERVANARAGNTYFNCI